MPAPVSVTEFVGSVMDCAGPASALGTWLGESFLQAVKNKALNTRTIKLRVIIVYLGIQLGEKYKLTVKATARPIKWRDTPFYCVISPDFRRGRKEIDLKPE